MRVVCYVSVMADGAWVDGGLGVMVKLAGGAFRCADCRGRFDVGDVVVVIDQGQGVYVHRDLYFHREHFDTLLANAPCSSFEVEAAQLLADGVSPVVAILEGL